MGTDTQPPSTDTMRPCLLLATLAVAACSTPTAETGAPAPPPAVPAPASDAPMHEHMDVLDSGQRAVHDMLAAGSPDREALRAELRAMEQAAVTIYGMTPPTPLLGVEGDLEAWRVDFRRTMARLLVTLLDMHIAALQDDAEAVLAGYDRLVEIKKQGHDAFRD